MRSCPNGLYRKGGKKPSIFAVSFQSKFKDLQHFMDAMHHKSVLLLWLLKRNLKFYQLLLAFCLLWSKYSNKKLISHEAHADNMHFRKSALSKEVFVPFYYL